MWGCSGNDRLKAHANRLSLLSLRFAASWLDVTQEALLVLFTAQLVGKGKIKLAPARRLPCCLLDHHSRDRSEVGSQPAGRIFDLFRGRRLGAARLGISRWLLRRLCWAHAGEGLTSGEELALLLGVAEAFRQKRVQRIELFR